MDTNFNNNRKLQDEEIEVLASIYGHDWKVLDEVNRSYSIDIVKDKKTVTLYVKFPPQYPTEGPPEYQLSAPYLTKEEKRCVTSQMEECYLKYMGESITLVWIGILEEFLNKKYDDQNNAQLPEEPDDISPMSHNPEPTFSVIHGEVITDRKSVFQGHAVLISSINEVKDVLAELYQNKKIAHATHNIYAYRLKGDKNCVIQDCEDDGEIHAGGRLLHLLEMLNLYGILVVVSRWYGSILLGPDRFKHITNAARRALLSAGMINQKK